MENTIAAGKKCDERVPGKEKWPDANDLTCFEPVYRSNEMAMNPIYDRPKNTWRKQPYSKPATLCKQISLKPGAHLFV